MEKGIKAVSPSHGSLERRGPCGCFSRDGGTWLQIFQLRTLPLFTREERFTGCISAQAAQQDIAEGWHAGSPHTHHPYVLPQACQWRASELTSPLRTFCPTTSLPSLVRFKTRFWKHASGFLRPVLLTFTVLSTWKTLCVPVVAIMLRPKFHLYFSLSFFFPPQTFHTQRLKSWLLAERSLTPPTISLTPSFVTFEKSYYILFMCTYVCVSCCLCGVREQLEGASSLLASGSWGPNSSG